jgi:hypothetical protein
MVLRGTYRVTAGAIFWDALASCLFRNSLRVRWWKEPYVDQDLCEYEL